MKGAHPRRRAWSLGGALVALALTTALAACGSSGDDKQSSTPQNGEVTKLTLASPAPDSLLTFTDVIARELGFYAAEQLEVELAAVSDNIPVAGLVQGGKADVGLVAAVDALAAASRTDEVQLAYDERTGGNGFLVGIVVPADSGVERLADLKGKNIGLASPDQDRAFLASALEAEGMTLDDVDTTVVGAGGPSTAQTLESGRVAAFVGTLQDFAAFDDAGLEVEDVTPDGLEGLPIGGYIVNRATLQEGDALVRFFRALAEGTYVGLERPQVAEAVTKQVAPEQWRDADVARSLLEGLTTTLRPFDGRSFGEIKPDRWRNAYELLRETDAIEGEVDVDAFLATNLLKQINDFDRRAVLARADRWLAENRTR